MKKIALFMLIGMFSSALCAQNKENDEEKNEKVPVPEIVKSAFQKDYPGKKAKWGSEDGDFEAEFKFNGKDASAIYDISGHQKEFEIEIATTELPKAALEYIAKNYADFKLTEAAKITTDKNIVTYEAEVGKKGKSWDVIFDVNGNFIKQEEAD